MSKSYADQCIERAEKATEGPWETYKSGDAIYKDGIKISGDNNYCDIIGGSIDYEQTGVDTEETAEFIAHARTDVPELCRRLKKACAYLKAYDSTRVEKQLADELEAPLGENHTHHYINGKCECGDYNEID